METVAAYPQAETRIFAPSRYLVVSEATYLSRKGDLVKFALSTRTGSLIALPPNIAEDLRDGVSPTTSEVLWDRLVQAEFVVPDDQDELHELLDRNREAARSTDVRTFVLLPTSYCNMGCGYCAQSHSRGRISDEHRSAVTNRVLRSINQSSTKAVDVRWFGGEPMAAYPKILDMGGRFRAAADQNGTRYLSRMVTNGSLLTVERLVRLRETAAITHYSITIDGPAEVHDRRRLLKNGGGSFHHIIKTIGDALSTEGLRDVVFEIRCNIDELNCDSVPELLDICVESGLRNPRVFYALEPVRTWSDECDMSDRTVQWQEFARQDAHWVELLTQRGLRFRSLPRASRPVVCEAVTRSDEVISSTGNLFSCTEKPLLPMAEANEAIGKLQDLHEDELRPLGPYDDWNDTIAAGEVPCRKCHLLGVCGGQCPKMWREGQVPCPTYRDNSNMQARLNAAAVHAGLSVTGGPAGHDGAVDG